MMRIAIFRPGKHKPDAPNITAADAQRIAESYDKKKHHAPMVIGHPASDDPAHGWVDSLSFKDGKLYANLSQVSKEFAKIVRDGAYKYISPAFYRPNASSNPVKGESYYLRHVGCLGAVPPAVKGLPPLAFGAGEDENDFFSIDFEDASGGDVDDGLPDLSKSVDELSQKVNDLEKKHMSEKTNKPTGGDDETANFAERENELAKREAAVKAGEAALAKKQADAERREIAQFVEGVVSEGKVLPRHKDGWVEFMCALKDDQVVNFAASDSKDGVATEGSGLDFVKDFLESLPQQIRYDEIAKDDGERGGNVVRLKVPNGEHIDTRDVALFDKVTKYANDKNLNFTEAFDQLKANGEVSTG